LDQAYDDTRLAGECARTIRGGFADYNADFRDITRRARRVFEERDWQAGRADAVERIDLYEKHVRAMIDTLGRTLGKRIRDHALWRAIKAEFAEQIRDYVDLEFTKTYFSSITRRIFDTVGIDPEVEFVALDYRPMESIRREPPLNVYELYPGRTARDVFLQVLDEYSYRVGWQDLRHSVTFLDRQLAVYSSAMGGLENVARLEFIRPVFYQNTRAYIVGRAVGVDGAIGPLVIALKNTGAGISVDAVLTRSGDVSMLFGFTRSYFHVDLETVADAVLFLRSMMPRKSVAEIFTVLGRAKQGKTERYRSFFRHLQRSTDLMAEAPGDKGMVMLVFMLPSYDVVFKIIRDRFAYPKTVVRKDVLEKYQLVFKHDRAGRLVDAQEFRLLRFHRDRFEPALLEELLSEASETCSIEDDWVVINHLYIERRMTPLNLFLREAAPMDARAAVLDYGQAIRDLSATNIFPGDLLLKNFGVTRNGRVIFYDYDELCLVTECNFREMPEPTSLEEEMQAEAWFYVGDDDVFPEQFASFLGLDPEHLEIFLEAHSELLTAAYWRDMKQRHLRGEVPEVLPYRPSLIAPPPGSLD
jgi:isocitrate dehydrogenase kinase/phosphatase